MAAIIYVEQVATLFRDLMDEQDETFVDDASVERWLEIGYNEFRQIVTDIDPQQFMQSSNIAVTTDTFDLDGTLLGSTATAANRMSQIVRLVSLDGASNPKEILTPVYSYESLVSSSETWPTRYMLQARVLKFSSSLSNTVRVEYIPVGSVDWSQINSGDNAFIDDLVQFHDIIALLAAKNYAIVDNAENTALLRQLEARLKHLESFLTRGRLRNANRFVQNESLYGNYV